jgi:tRNA(Ile)-lysidine synthase
MQLPLAHRVLRTIEEHRMFRAGDRIGAGVSGGADSVALLRVLEELRGRLGFGLSVLHFNHQLRGAESDADERFVETLAAERGFEYLAGRGDVAAEARARGWNIEDAARRMRYAFFESAVRAGQVTHVAVGHTADDQAETVLARLIRGTGPSGLAAIYPVKGHVVRPLLEVRQGELREYLEQSGQAWREDASNLDTSRLRARLRHKVLPAIENELQPAVVDHLSRLAQMAREDESFWAALVAERLGALAAQEEGRIGIRREDLLSPIPWAGAKPGSAAQTALTKRLVRGLAEELEGGRLQLTAQHVDQVVHLAAESSSGRRTELPGIVAERAFDWIWFASANSARDAGRKAPKWDGSGSAVSGPVPGETKEFSYSVQLPAAGETVSVAVPEIGKCFRLKVIDWPVLARDTSKQVYLDRDSLQSPVLLRNWRPGDSFRPTGRRNVRKLKQLLRSGRVVVRDRAGWPVLTSGGSLVWSRGFPVAADFAPRDTTRAGVVITEEKI